MFEWLLGKKPVAQYLVFLLLVPPTVTYFTIVEFYANGIDTGSTLSLLRNSYPQRFLRETASEGLGQGSYVVNLFTELATRYIWMASGVIFGTCLFGVCLISLWLMYRNFNATPIWIVCAILLVATLPEIVEGRLCFTSAFELRRSCAEILASMDISPENFGLSVISLPLGYLDQEFRDYAVRGHIRLVKLLGFTMVMLGLAASATLSARNDKVGREARLLSEQIRHGQIFLYCSCVVLTASVLYSDIWGRWPVRLMPSVPERDNLAAYQDQATVALGVAASAILLATYIPLSLAHHWRAVKLANSQIDHDGADEVKDANGWSRPEKFLLDHGLTSPLSTQVQKIIALLLPALAGQLLTLAPSFAGIG